MKRKLTWPIFWALIGVFIVVVCLFFVPAFRDLLRGSELFLVPIAIFFLLGAALIFLTLKEKVGGILQKFLLLTGASAVGFFVSILLHNAFYGLGTLTSHITVLSYSMEVLHTAFFIIAIPICPIGFLVGTVGSIAITTKNRQAKHPSENI